MNTPIHGPNIRKDLTKRAVGWITDVCPVRGLEHLPRIDIPIVPDLSEIGWTTDPDPLDYYKVDTQTWERYEDQHYGRTLWERIR